jgi:hypothetical protein
MIDKISGGIPVTPAESTTTTPGGFSKVLNGATKPPSQPAQLDSSKAADASRASTGPGRPVGRSLVVPATKVAVAVRPTTTQVVGQIAESQRQLDRILRMAESGRTFTPAQLLAFQAHAYRASQEVDLAGKVVDKATGAVKQTLQTQV